MGSVLIFVGTSGNLMLGALGLFVFSLGLSTVLLIMALSAGLAARFPAPGPWLSMLKVGARLGRPIPPATC